MANQIHGFTIDYGKFILISVIPQFQLGNIRSHDAFRPIPRKQKDLMDYNFGYSQLKIKESFHIEQLKPELNKQVEHVSLSLHF